MKISFLVTLLLSACVISGAQKPVSAEADVIVNGPVVVGYFPPVTEEEINNPGSGAGEGIAHVRFALEDTLKCLKASGIEARAQLEMVKALKVTEGTSTKRLALPTTWPEAAGAYLFLPGKPARMVPAQAGPSSLITLVPEAAAEYFGAKACREQ